MRKTNSLPRGFKQAALTSPPEFPAQGGVSEVPKGKTYVQKVKDGLLRTGIQMFASRPMKTIKAAFPWGQEGANCTLDDTSVLGP